MNGDHSNAPAPLSTDPVSLPQPLRIKGPDGKQYTSYAIRHYQAFERGMEARKGGKESTACPYRAEIMVGFWLAGFNSPSAIAATVKP